MSHWQDARGCRGGGASTSPACRLSELEEVADGADHRPFGSDLIEISQQELPKASGLLHLPKDGLHHLLSEPIAASPASLLVHPSSTMSFPTRTCVGDHLTQWLGPDCAGHDLVAHNERGRTSDTVSG